LTTPDLIPVCRHSEVTVR